MWCLGGKMIAKISAFNPAGNNPKTTSAALTCQNGYCQEFSEAPQVKENKPGLALSLKLLIAAFCATMGYCIFMGMKNTFARAK